MTLQIHNETSRRESGAILHLADYASAPPASAFSKWSLLALQGLASELDVEPSLEWPEWGREAHELSRAAAALACKMAADGVTVLVAMDDDGPYFATHNQVWLAVCNELEHWVEGERDRALASAALWALDDQSQPRCKPCEIIPFAGVDVEADCGYRLDRDNAIGFLAEEEA